MRLFLLGAASAVAMLSPAAANAETGGYVDLSLGQLSIEDTDLDTITLGGAAAADLSDNWRAQFDVAVNRISDGGEGFTLTNGAAHAYYEGAGWAAGGVLTNVDLGFASIWSLGAEGQMTFGQLVVEGELSVGTLEVFGSSTDTTSFSANGTYYLMDNFSIGAGYASLDVDEAFGTINTLSLDAEYQFSGSANSVFLNYANSDYDDIDEESDAWRIGFRHSFGDDSLAGRRQNGPRWLPVSTGLFQFIT